MTMQKKRQREMREAQERTEAAKAQRSQQAQQVRPGRAGPIHCQVHAQGKVAKLRQVGWHTNVRPSGSAGAYTWATIMRMAQGDRESAAGEVLVLGSKSADNQQVTFHR